MVEGNLWWKTNFGGRRSSVEDDLKWKTTFGGHESKPEILSVVTHMYRKENIFAKTTKGSHQ